MLASWPLPALISREIYEKIDTLDTRDLIKLFQDGPQVEKPEIFSEIYNRYTHSLWNYIHCCIPESEPDAKDIFCQIWFVALEELASFNWPLVPISKDPLRAWLFECARRRIKEYYRIKQQHPDISIDLLQDILALEVEEAMPSPSPHAELITHLKYVISNLKAIHQKLLELRYRYNRSFKDIGEALGKSEGAARKQHHDVLCKLRKELEGVSL